MFVTLLFADSAINDNFHLLLIFKFIFILCYSISNICMITRTQQRIPSDIEADDK